MVGQTTMHGRCACAASRTSSAWLQHRRGNTINSDSRHDSLRLGRCRGCQPLSGPGSSRTWWTTRFAGHLVTRDCVSGNRYPRSLCLRAFAFIRRANGNLAFGCGRAALWLFVLLTVHSFVSCAGFSDQRERVDEIRAVARLGCGPAALRSSRPSSC